ncbi:RNA polymerase sigma-70 factor, ECF subfamily [Gracilimonas mengyeensis]|uniref:RNA polymerase sigma-70 factor, ECF subfamily n=2 Tax=Gracilimonas mengyeensis TaxID=1302730 RepID=A0A521B1H4_9BACT|nr:RNA polymerase sigma-70 factor, ECF subfamily [Gracilimonas mengyeensis]
MEQDEVKFLVRGLAEGDEWAFKNIFLLYYEPLCNFCWRYTKSKAISEDLVQEMFADVWHNRAVFDPNKCIRLYLYKAVKNKALDYLDHQRVIREYEEEQQKQNTGIDEQGSFHQDNEQFIIAAREAIYNLPHRTQQIYILSREDGFTYPEIADIMDISTKTVEAHISKALDMLRIRLRKLFPEQVTERTIAKIFSFRSTGTK